MDKHKNMGKESNQQPVSENASENAKVEPKTVVLTEEEFGNIKLQLADAQNDYKELERDFDNARKRFRDDLEKAKMEGITDAIKTVLPALDSFKKARKIVHDKAVLSGIDLIEKNIFSALGDLKVKKIDCVGKHFDPDFHNAVLTMIKEGVKPGTIIEEIESGYILGDKVIVYSQVVVAK